MKNLLIVFLSGLLLSGLAFNADAAFYVKKHAETSASSSESILTGHKRAERRKQKERDRENDNNYRIQQAKIAFRFALLGLILFPLGIPAIVHGVRSIKKKEWYFRDMALTSIIFGSLEILALAFFITMAIFMLL